MDNRGRRFFSRFFVATIKLLIVALVIWFVRRTLSDAWEQLSQHSWRINWLWLIVAGFFYLLGTLPCGVFWHRLLQVLGQKIPLSFALRAYYVGHLGKYVPGKALVVILRAGIVARRGADMATAAVAVFLETLTMMATGAFLSAGIVAIWFGRQTLLLCVALLIMLLAGLPTLPPTLKLLLPLLGTSKIRLQATEKLKKLHYNTIFLGWVFNGAGWFLQALSLWATVQAIGNLNGGTTNVLAVCHAPWQLLYVYIASVALATVAGFVSLIPGGVIIREAVLAQLLAPSIGEATAVLSAVLLRFVQIVAELTVSAMLYSGEKIARQR